MMKKITLYLAAVILLISCNDSYNTSVPGKPTRDPTAPTPNIHFAKNNVFLSSGINFETGKTIVFNTLTGEKVAPCENSIIIASPEQNNPGSNQRNLTSEERKSVYTEKSSDANCHIEIVRPNMEMQAILKASESQITGTILKNGKEIPARFVVQITALYKGSFCTTTYSGGDQYQVCLNETSSCLDFKNFIEPDIRAYFGGSKTEDEIRKIIFDYLPDVCKQQFPLEEGSE